MDWKGIISNLSLLSDVQTADKDACLNKHNDYRGHVGDSDAGGKTASGMTKLVSYM